MGDYRSACVLGCVVAAHLAWRRLGQLVRGVQILRQLVGSLPGLVLTTAEKLHLLGARHVVQLLLRPKLVPDLDDVQVAGLGLAALRPAKLAPVGRLERRVAIGAMPPPSRHVQP